jgi:hypothetical protein
MTARDQNAATDRDVAPEGDEEGLDSEQLKEKLGFIWRAPRRRPMLAAFLFVLVAGLGLTIAATMPRSYHVQVKLLAQHDLLMPALSNPSRPVPRDADSPTRNVAAIILRRENLVALIKESNLLERWHASRSPALRLKDKLLASLSGPQREEDELQTLAQTLEKKMTVIADDNTVTIGIDWSDPKMAYELVTLVKKNFIEARYDSDVMMIQDAITVLEEHAKTELEQVDSALAAYQALRGAELSTAPPPPVAAPADSNRPATTDKSQPAPAAAPSESAPAVSAVDSDLTRALDEKRRQIRVLEDERQRSLEALKQQLVQAQLTLTPMHPTVVALQGKLDALRDPSPELAERKSEERALMAQIAPVSGIATPPRSRSLALGLPAPDVRRPAPLAAETKTVHEDQSLAPARSRLDAAIYRYQEVMARVDSAKLELDITRTAFRYRYSVITPAEIPHGPKRPIALLVGVGSVLAAVLLAFLGAAGADWRTGRFLETWQIRRRLKIDVLGELEPPR